MKKILLPACIIAIISLSACNGNGSENDTNNSAMQPTTSTTPPVATDSLKNVFTDSTKATGTTSNQQVPPSIPAQSTTAALNPEHGQPGHRCDIAVGAPLSSSPQQQFQQPAPATQTLPMQPQPATNAGGIKLNPAHGQPGHDCAIPVGQPLKS
jgi:hypothetical protein